VNTSKLAKSSFEVAFQFGDNGLTLLTHLHAMQELNGDKIDLHLSSAQRKKPSDRSLTLRLYYSNDGLIFDSEGKLLSTSIDAPESIMHVNHPLRYIYLATNNGARIDIQGTTEALVEAIGEMETFDIRKMIKYDPNNFQSRIL